VRLVVSKQSLRLALRWVQRVLFASAVAMLAWCGFVLGDAWVFQKQVRGQLERQFVAPISLKTPPPAVCGDLIGRIEITRLGLSAMVIEGTDQKTLRRSVGHIPGTALPGQSGNIGFSGHRDTFFRPLRNIRRNDVITVTTPFGEYCYRVVSTGIVSPRDVAVLDPGKTEILTLVTCYPFYFVGSAPDRFIVRAERIENSS
jgi:sortase A